MTVKVFDMLSSGSLGDIELVRNAFRIRQKVFNSEQNYNMPSWQGMEFDEYDNIAASYLVRPGGRGTVLGVVRLVPTKFQNYDRSMIGDLWPQAVDGKVPSGENIYEGSRIVVEPELSINKELRSRVISELVLATQEFGLSIGAEALIGVMHPKHWQSVFENRGWPYEALGGAVEVGEEGEDKFTIQVGLQHFSREIHRNIEENTGVKGPILEIAPAMQLPKKSHLAHLELVGNQAQQGVGRC